MSDSTLPRARVLIIEDEDAVGIYFREALSSAFDAEVVDTVAGAMERMKRGSIDAAMLDLGLPNGEGLELVQRFQREFPDVPMVVVTGMNFTPEQVIEAGAQDFIQKPDTSPKRLINVLAKAIARHRVRRMFKEVKQVVSDIKQAIEQRAERLDDASREADKIEIGINADKNK